MEDLNLTELVNSYAIPWGIKIVFAVVIFYVGRIVVAAVVNIVGKLMRNSDMDEMLVLRG